MQKTRMLIDVEDFQNFLMKYSISDDFEKMFENTTFFNKPYSEDLFQAMQHGLIWAGMLAGSCENKKYFRVELSQD